MRTLVSMTSSSAWFSLVVELVVVDVADREGD